MDILIETATGNEVQRWGGKPSRIRIKAEKITCDPGDDARPMPIGPNHFLATATVVEPPLGPNQRRGPETVVVVGQTVTVTRPAVDMTQDEINARGRIVSFDAFASRFSEAEKDALAALAGLGDPATGELKHPNVARAIAMKEDVDLKDPKTAAVLQLLVDRGGMTAAKKTKILTP